MLRRNQFSLRASLYTPSVDDTSGDK